MKSIAFFALSLVATAAMAASPYGASTISITGTSTQTASVNHSTVGNTAQSKAYANQNIASNKGAVSISGTSEQTSILDNATVMNSAKSAGDVAVQNLASNVGSVGINKSTSSDPGGMAKGSGQGSGGKDDHVKFTGTSSQTANVVGGSSLSNEANSAGRGCSGSDCWDAALAYQNAASNMGTVNVSGESTQTVGISGGSTVRNQALGSQTVAVQNMSSNYGTVNISGKSTQTTSIYGGSVVANLANGTLAHAYQNIASNDSCDPPPVVCVGPACGPYASR